MGVYDNLNNASVGSPKPVNIFDANPRQRAVEDVGGVSVRDVREPVKSSPVTAGNAGYTGGSGNGQAAVDYMQSLWTSPDEEKRLRKASVANQRVLAIGDALRHLGNIYNTVNGAPAQTFNSPVMEEYSRYEKGKALRDAANQRYLAYQQAKANQDALQKRWEADREQKERHFGSNMAMKAASLAEQAANRKERARQSDRAYNFSVDKWNQQYEQNERKFKANTAHQRAMEGIASDRVANEKIYRKWRMNGGGSNGTPIPPLDTPNGKITPSGRNYSNQIKQMWDYAESEGLVTMSDVQKALQEAGFEKETPDNVKAQQVMKLLRTNQKIADYARDRLGWTYGGGASDDGMDMGLEEDDDDLDMGLN